MRRKNKCTNDDIENDGKEMKNIEWKGVHLLRDEMCPKFEKFIASLKMTQQK
jgi:hypothetical protein